jgi:formylglycine-generating enzyme required for sulfatase activity
VFGVARTGAFLLSPDEAARARRTSGTNMGLKAATAEARRAPSSSEPEAAWAALAEWASGKRDAAREFASSPAAASVPEELRGLLARCLAKTPARRPATPGRLHAALNALAACPWSRAGTLCEGCGFVLAEDHVAATCPCCGRRRAPPEGLSDRLAEAPHRWERHGPPATGGAATQVAVQTENMTLVPAGVFVSGENKAPRTLRAFAVDTRPVTEGDYKRFLAAAGRAPRANGAGSRGPEFDSHPVTRVTWYEANEYAEFHGERLPTVYEWEKAARGTDGRRFPFGNTFKPGTGRLLKSTADGARKRARAPVGTAPVGSQPGGASPYGVLDMAGNVLQWTSTARRAGERLFRAVKGSCYLDGSPELARCTSVQYLPPEASEPYLGFRCVKDVE